MKCILKYMPPLACCVWLVPLFLVNNNDGSDQNKVLKYLEDMSRYYDKNIKDYQCVFVRQEKIKNKMMKEQQSNVIFIEDPFSLLMHIFKNPSGARRILYVKGKFVDKNGREMMWVEPSNSFLRLFASKVLIPIDDDQVLKSSNNTVQSFGIKNLLNRLITGVKADDEIEIVRFNSTIIAYIMSTGRLVEIYIGEQIKLLCGVKIFEDSTRKNLTSKYFYNNLKINTGLTQSDFEL